MNRRAIIPLIILIGLMVPLAQAVTIDGPTNFQGTHGGTVHFNPNVISSNIAIADAIYRYTGFTIGGINRGALSFDCSTGCTMTILTVTRYQIRYQVAAAGVSTQYVYYGNNNNEPQGTNTDAIVFNAATGISTVTTTGNVIVTLDYATFGALGIDGLNMMFGLFPLIALIVGLEARKQELINNRVFLYLMVFAAAAFVILAIRTLGG